MKYLLSLLICLATAGAAGAAEKWTYVSSDRFEVYATGGAGRAREALEYFERVHRFFADFLKLTPRQTRPARIVVFSGMEQFEPYRPNNVASGYYMSGPGMDVIVMSDLDADAYATVVHEYAHLVMRYAGAAYPVWLNEGLAEFFSTMVPQGGAMAIGKVPRWQLPTLGSSGLMPMDRLLAVTTDSREYNSYSHVGTFYAQSWALTHMLMTDERYRGKTDQFLQRMAGGGSSSVAMESVYDKTTETIAAELGVYIRRSQFLYYLAKYQSAGSAPNPPTRAVDDFEAGVMTATLLANLSNHEEEGRAAFEKLAAAKPDDLRLLEARGLFEWRSGHREPASTLLSRAVSLGSTNPLVYRVAADVDASRQTELLAKGVSLAPDDLDLRLDYASALLRRRQFGAVVATINGAPRVTPDKAFDVFMLLGSAFGSLNRPDDAKKAVARASEYVTTEVQRNRAAQLAAQLDGRPAPAPVEQRSNLTSSPAAGPRGLPLSFTAGLTTMKGRIVNMVCDATAPVLEVKADGDPVRLLIDDPQRIYAAGPNGAIQFELACGALDVPIEVGYLPRVDRAKNTSGVVRTLLFPEAK